MRNPFKVGQPVPPESFVGRQSLIDIAFDQINNRSNLAIWGGPGMGKTSFLNLLKSEEVWQSQEIDQFGSCLTACSKYPFASCHWFSLANTVPKR